MFDIFHQYILQKTAGKASLSSKEREMIQLAFIQKKLRKKQYFLQEGDVLKHHGFVCKGCLRMYRRDAKGQEFISQFAIENWWIGDRESITSGKASKYNIDALEESDILLITKDELEALSKKIPAIQTLVQIVQENNVIATQNRIHAAISFSAEEKYLDFLQTYPDLFQRLPQQMIASYLGITRETLSRIRKQAVPFK